MTSAIRALAYADWRAFLNGLRQIRKSPGRLIMWTLFALIMLMFVAMRTFLHGSSRYEASYMASDIVQADYLVSGFLVLFFMSITTGIGTIGLFRSRAEARFIIGSPVSPLVAVPYLQLRDAIVQSWNILFRMAYFFLIFAPHSLNGWQAVLLIILALSSLIALTTVVLPRRIVKRPIQVFIIICAVPLTIVSALPAIRGAIFQLHPSPELLALAFRYLPAWHPGSVLIHPTFLWIAIGLAVAVCALGLLVLVSRDAYTELYALSMQRLDAVERVAARKRGDTNGAALVQKKAQATSSLGSGAPAGLLIFVWKAALELRRMTTARTFALAFFGIGLIGFALSDFAPDILFYTMLVNLTFSGAILTSARGAMSLGLELRRPLFWLSHGSLLQRLGAISVGRLLQPTVYAASFIIGIALAAKSPDRLIIIALGFPAYILLQQAIGILVFAISPNVLDLRGPLGGLRILIAFVSFIAPGIAFGVIAYFLHGGAFFSILGADAIALAETAAFLVLAAMRLEGGGDRLIAA
jgi:hypothetical protein